jgi:rhodanese-related sulfurtransferase
MTKHLLVLFVGLILTSCGGGSTSSEQTALGPEDFQKLFQSTEGAVLLDVRTMEEVKAERIKGEVNFDYNAPEFNILIKGLDKSKPYFVYCGSGVRSGKAADKLREEGYNKVYTLNGGLKAWKKAGLPVQN